MTERVRLGELLLELGLIDQGQLDAALEAQKSDKRRLGELLVGLGAVDEAQVTQVLSQQLSVPWVSLSHIDFSRKLLNLVSAEIAQKYGVVPIYVRRSKNRQETLYVAMQDPSDQRPLQEMSEYAGLPVKAMIAPPTDIRAAIRAYYLGLPPETDTAAVLLSELQQDPVLEEEAPVSSQSDPPVKTESAVLNDGQAVLNDGQAVTDAQQAVPDNEQDVVVSQDVTEQKIVTEEVEKNSPQEEGSQDSMVTLTMLDGTQITLPARKKSGASEGQGLTAHDLVEALRAQGSGTDASEVLGEDVNWQKMFAALLSLLLKKHLINDWEFVRELKR
ncbi:MAG: hypothetical protein MK135_02420 [Polyangiaceae bacterium]|nr:hypothetical protein [Polyangiaceae bacterium]